MNNLLRETKSILNKYNIKPNKNLGQNFLIKQEILDGIICAAEVEKEDLVIEIGPGLGTLTKNLLEKARKVLCIELDDRMIQILEDRFKLYNNIQILRDDILKVDLQNKIKEVIDDCKKVKIVANLPYYITTPIIMKLLEEKLDIESITVMVQKEVADRLIAKPGTSLSGSISYAISYYTSPEYILSVPKDSFIPQPEVESAVIRLNVLKEPSLNVKNEEVFFKIIKLAFMQRRKTLVNALYNGKLVKDKKELENILQKMGLDIRIRGEKMSMEEFSRITEIIDKCWLE